MDALSHRIAVARRFGLRISAGNAVFQSAGIGALALPCTVTDGEIRQMSGMNLFVLLEVMKDRGWVDPRFFTTAQITTAGWAIRDNSSGVRLQFLISTDNNGLGLETPESRTFMVFNAEEIEGVPLLETRPGNGVLDIQQAVASAGYFDNDINNGVRRWAMSLQDDAMSADMLLRAELANCLLAIQGGYEHSSPSHLPVEEWINGIEADPISLFYAVRDAEKLSAEIMKEVRLVTQERAAAHMINQSAIEVKKETNMGQKVWGGGDRIRRMFEERESILAVPFKDKARAMALGAMWYAPEKLWFVPKGLDTSLFNEWNPRSSSLGEAASREVLLDSFCEAMQALGLDISDEIKDDGKWHSVSVPANKGKNLSGSYILSLDGGRNGEAIGTIINRFSGESHTWKYEGALLTPEQKARIRADALIREEAVAREIVQTQALAAEHANEILMAGSPALGHGYVVKQGIDPVGLRQVPGKILLKYPEYYSELGRTVIRENENYLLIPMMDRFGELRALQAINSDGSIKSFMRGAQKKGTMLVLGADSFNAAIESDALGIGYVEGFATGVSFHSGIKIPVVVCFDAGNLETVVDQTAEYLPLNKTVILGVDNDQFYIERAIGLLSQELGLNPHCSGGQVVNVANGSHGVRQVSLGEIIADGEWQQMPKGGYRVCLTQESDNDAIRSVLVEIVPVNGRMIRSTFVNRGVEAGTTALAALEKIGKQAAMLIPSFQSLAGRPTDWNDLQKREGLLTLANEAVQLGFVRKEVEREMVGIERGQARSRNMMRER